MYDKLARQQDRTIIRLRLQIVAQVFRPPRIGKLTKRRCVRLVIVDDHVFMRELVARALAQIPKRYAVLAAVGTAAQAVRACKKLKPDVLILDTNLPDKDGIDAVRELREAAPATRILLCTGFPTDERLSHLAGTGAHGFVEKTNTWDDFLHAVEQVSRGKYYFCSHHSGITAKPRREHEKKRMDFAPHLTSREKEIIALIAGSLTTKEMAIKLHISAATVATHRTNLMTKLGVRNAVGLVSYAIRMGLARPTSNV
jgi:DNA-binding NarL/FixJ family response regulator